MARRARNDEVTCNCAAYRFPHREGGGACEPDDDHGECGSCGGSGGGDRPMHCPMCSGTGTRPGWKGGDDDRDYDDDYDDYDDDPRSDYF
jgi:hypothetical protein